MTIRSLPTLATPILSATQGQPPPRTYQRQRPTEARLLTDRLRASVAPGPRYTRQQSISERDGNLQLVLEGTVVRQRIMSNGRCQTLAVYQRDDVINLSRFVRRQETTDSLIALRGTVMASVDPAIVEELRQMSVSGIDGMAALVLRELSISQERLASLGRRSAIQSLAHFFCETLLRCHGLRGNTGRCGLAMTQDMLAETLGMTSVHVNRTLQAIRATGFADLAAFELVVHDFDALAELGEFDAAYLAPV